MRISLKHLKTLLLTIATVATALAQQPVTKTAPSVDRLRAHVEYLASDKLEGRLTASPGANLAAEYIAHKFARLGLRRSIGRDLPGMSRLEADSPRRYLQEFPYVAGVELGNNNLLFVKPRGAEDAQQFKVGEDWLPLGFSSNAEVKSTEAVFVGYGISSAELKYDDYAVSSAKGRVAIAFAGTPEGDNPHGQFGRAGEIRFKVAAARAAGARALLIIANEERLNDDRLSRLYYDNAGEAGIPVLVVSRQAAAKILGGTITELGIFEKAADSRGLTSNNADRLRQPTSHRIDLSVDVVRREVAATNVIGILDGSDPVLKNETIVIGAHYDHLGRGGRTSLAQRAGEIHHGADDNASGVAGVLELARMFSAQRPRRTIVFAAFSGEEEGLLGSNYYVNHPVVPMNNTVAMINMDMIGRMKDNKLIVGGVGTAEGWRQAINHANANESLTVAATPQTSGEITPASTSSGSRTGRTLPIVTGINGRTIVSSTSEKSFDLTLNQDGFGPSDHSSFYAKQVPVLFFWTGTHEDYHKPSDTAEKISYTDQARIVSLIARLVRDIDRNDKRPVYTTAKSEPTGRSSGFRVYLGTIPNYADSNDGLLLDGVRDDSPAAKAGIKAGDTIVKLAGREVRNVYDYTAALGEMKAGEEYEVELLRGGERIKLTIIPAARK